MEELFKKNSVLSGSHLIILIGNTVMSSMLVFESLRNHWETWAVVLIIIMGIMCWILHVIQFGSSSERIWIYAVCMMMTFFFYGVHPTSRFDMSVVMGAIIMLFAMAGVGSLILMAQITYYITIGYNLVDYFLGGGKFDPLTISRTVLHVVVMTLIAWFARIIVRKWKLMLDDIGEKMGELSETTERLDDFLANASHEIRTPVNAVVGLTSVCVDRGINEDNLEDVNAIRDAGRRVASQMSDILDYSEIDRNILVANKENYMISSLLFDLVSEL